MRALFASALAVALFGWGHHAEVRSVVALLLVVVAVCTLEASHHGSRRREVTP